VSNSQFTQKETSNMKRLILSLAAAGLLAPASAFAAKAQPSCSTGTLLDVQMNTEQVGTTSVGSTRGARNPMTVWSPTTRKHTSYQVTVALDGMIYTGEANGDLFNYKPTNMVVHDPVQACVDGKKLILTRPDGKQYKTSIVRVARATGN
jgi:hypothetical protein